MMEDKFKIINLVKQMIVYVDQKLVNFPKKEIELKQEIRKSSYDLLLVIQEANVTSNLAKRVELIEKAIAIVKQLDFLINLCADKMIINDKRYFKFGESLNNIIRYLVGWINATNQAISK